MSDLRNSVESHTLVSLSSFDICLFALLGFRGISRFALLRPAISRSTTIPIVKTEDTEDRSAGDCRF